MTSTTIIGRLRTAARTILLTTVLPLAAVAPAAASDGNMEKVDIVAEGIDLKPIYVGSTQAGYTATETAAHKFMVRVYAKASGQNRVWRVDLHSGGTGLVMFHKDVGKSEGWATYGNSFEVNAKPQNLKWVTFPKTVCDQNMANLMLAGQTKAQVLANDRKVTAYAYIYFSAYADSKGNNKKGKHQTVDGINPHNDNVAYAVPVVCRAAL